MTMLRRLGVACTVACALASCMPAFAEAPAAASTIGSTVVDLGPLINAVAVPLVMALGSVLVTWLTAKAAAFLGLKANDERAAILEKAMQNGLAFAQSQLQAKIGAGPIPLDVKNEIIATAAGYAVAHAPEAMKTLGVDPESLAQKLEARLSLNTTPAAQSIAVPTDPAGVR